MQDDTWSCIIVVVELDDTKPGPSLYGFYKSPALDVLLTILLSQLFITRNGYITGASGNEGLHQWLEDPTYPNMTLSWNLIHGFGKIHQKIYTSANYYIAVGNLNTEDIEVELDLRVEAYLYNTTQPYYKRSFTHGQCSLDVLFPTRNTALVVTPSPGEGTPSAKWYVKLS
ncbi:hypothetical protein SAY87_023885 [Trapa incisa]|uniref:E3 ubiquitin-protein ligase APD1-4 middle domain-containing protein n=1 Tax=Trapa incisa TaxID=236973 RepID=A0AAN7QQQ9_9MYRT|nr:hypothetical protein SAY87_023885 [Trapa incisa]